MKAKDIKNQPYVSNYPPLQEWLQKHEAVCNWQVAVGHLSFVESWTIGATTFLLQVFGNCNGWNLYTATRDSSIVATFKDAEKRLGL